MGDNKDENQTQGGVSISATTSGVRVASSEGVLSRIFSRRWAKAAVDRAMGDRVARKLAAEEGLDPAEIEFFKHLYPKEVERNRNLLEVLRRTDVLLSQRVQVLDGGRAEAGQLALPPGAEEEPELDPRWKARFVRDAEDAADETMRDLLARILAGEFERPGAFSLKTLSVVRDLDQRTARLFEAVSPMVVLGNFLPPYADAVDSGCDFAAYYEKRDVSFGGIVALVDAGLLTAADDILVQHECGDGDAFEWKVEIAGGSVLVCQSRDPAMRRVALPGMGLTAAGAELLTVLAPQLDSSYPECVARWISHAVDGGYQQSYFLRDRVLGTEALILEVPGSSKPE